MNEEWESRWHSQRSRYLQWRRGLALGLLLGVMPIQAREPTPYADCFDMAGQHYGLAPELLEAIAHAESRSEPTALNTSNRDGSWDIGLMQINSRWLPVLERAGLAAQQLYDPCTSIWVGAWVLAGNVARYGYNWNAVGAYNAGTAATAAAQRRRERYADRIRRLLCRADGLCADDATP